MFGYSPQSVRLLLTDRDAMFVRAQERLRSTELKVNELETQLETTSEKLREVRERADRAEATEGRVAELETELSTARENLLQLEVLRERADRVETAESRVVMLESELDAVREELERRAKRAESDEARIVRLEIDLDAAREELARGTERITEFASADAEDLSTILGTAETAFTRMIDRARRNSEEQLARTEHLRRKTEADIDQLAAWRDHVQPLIASVQASVEDASTRISQVPDLIRSALAPMTDAIGAVSTGLNALAEASTAPSTTAPSRESGASSAEQIVDRGQKSGARQWSTEVGDAEPAPDRSENAPIDDAGDGEGTEEPGAVASPGAGNLVRYEDSIRWSSRRV